MHQRLTLCLLLLCAAPLAAQHGPVKEGDLIPRSGTLMYMVSDRPEAAYRLFGTDSKGNWRLRGIAQSALDKQSGGMDEEGAKAAQAVFDYVFNSYESLARVEIGLVDVTLDGPKYIVHLQLKPGRTMDLTPEFLGGWLSRTVDYRERKVLMYRLDAGEGAEEGPGDSEGDESAPGGPGTNYFGMNRYYVTDLGGSVLLSNFESTIREGVDLFLDRDEAEALSGRAEFKEWLAQRKPHDLSTFVIGREVQNLIERLMPSKEQAGMDVQKIYADLDAWIQFREYRYIAVDIDYDDKARGITLQSTVKTRRPTKFLEKLGMPPKRFDGMKYVPSNAVLVAGAQMGEPQKTWDNIIEFARDMQKSLRELERMGTPWSGREPDWPEDDEDSPGMPPLPPQPPVPEQPDEDKRVPDDAHLPRNLGPMRMFGDIARALQMQPEEPEEPAEDDMIGQALKQMEESLGQYGTSIKEILSVLGGEVVMFADIDAARLRAMPRGNPMEALGAASFGVVITLKDAKLATSILERAREKDPEGAFKGIQTIEAQGRKFYVTAERNFGYVITGDALLVCYAESMLEEGDQPAVVNSLSGMITAASKKTTADPFIGECSGFMLLDIGRVARMQQEMADEQARRLDRYVRPNMDQTFQHLSGMQLAMRSREFKNLVEFTVRLNGLPDLGMLLEQAVVGGGGGDTQAWHYTEDNLRRVGNAMRQAAEGGKEITLDSLVAGGLRKAALQTPFDARWKGDRGAIGWITLDQLERDEEGNLPPWVDEAAAAMIDQNEKDGFVSYRLADGAISQYLKEFKSGMIVLYQEKADSHGGHFVLYADGQVGWLHADVLKQALELNKEGKPVPAGDMWEDDEEGEEMEPGEGE